MFARLATILAIGRRRALPANALPGYRINPVRARKRPNLRCRWHLDPASGRPVCAWDIDDVPLQKPARGRSALRRLDRNAVNATKRIAVAAVDASSACDAGAQWRGDRLRVRRLAGGCTVAIVIARSRRGPE